MNHLLYVIVLFSTFQTVSFSMPLVKTGIDVLISNEFSDILNKKVILFTNSTGRTQDGTLTAEYLANESRINLVSIITPEHGFFASFPAGEKVANEKLFGVPVFSLYGEIRKPGSKILQECDLILVDIQDIGVRSYTYISTLFRILQAAAENNKPVYILDRPNPLGGNNVDGNILEKGMESFVGIVPITYIHGLTIGEFANLVNSEGWLGENSGKNLICDIKIIKMQNYQRNMVWEDTGLMWFPTSPNVPTINSVRGLATIGIFGELGVISIGIGTTVPFQLIGSTDFDWIKVKNYLGNNNFAGISITRQRYIPQYGMYQSKSVSGIMMNFLPQRTDFYPYTTGIKLFLAIRSAYPDLFLSSNIKENSKNMFQKVTGTSNLFNAMFNGVSDENVLKIANTGVDDFKKLRSKYLLYE